MQVGSSTVSNPALQAGPGRAEFERVMDVFERNGVEVRIAPNLTDEQLGALADAYDTPSGRARLEAVAREAGEWERLTGSPDGATITFSEGDGGLMTNLVQVVQDEPGEAPRLNLELTVDDAFIDGYRRDVADGSYDNPGLKGSDPIFVVANELSEMEFALETQTDLLERGVPLATAAVASSNLHGHKDTQILTYGIDVGRSWQADAAVQGADGGLAADAETREGQLRQVLATAPADAIVSDMTIALSDVAGAYASDPLLASPASGGEAELVNVPHPSLAPGDLEPGRNGVTEVAPGVVRLENGVVLPRDSAERLAAFAQERLEEAFPGRGITVGFGPLRDMDGTMLPITGPVFGTR